MPKRKVEPESESHPRHEDSIPPRHTDTPSEDGEDSQDGRMPEEMGDITFGALAEAQDTYSSEDHRRADHERDRAAPSEKVAALKARLAELRNSKTGKTGSNHNQPKEQNDAQEVESRSSKHAPMEQSSRRQVTRYRPPVELPNNPQGSRDPRFSAVSTSQAHVDPEKFKKQYAFLTTYRDNELVTLKSTLTALKAKAKKRKSKQFLPDEEEEAMELKRQINSIENKKKSEDAKDRERQVIRKHRKEEREQVKQGKKPYFLKHGEAKKMAEKERWEGLKGKERKKLEERREKRRNRKEKRAVESV